MLAITGLQRSLLFLRYMIRRCGLNIFLKNFENH